MWDLRERLGQARRRWLVTGGAGFIGSNLLETLLRGPTELAFALAPRGENGSTEASLELDYLELKLEYRIP